MISKADPPRHLRPRHAFSLIELLVVIAILGILIAVGIAFIGGNQREAMITVRDQRNAQEIVSLTTTAAVCGADVIVPGDMEATIRRLIEGRTATGGQFDGRLFQISSMTPDEIQGAIRFLVWQGNQPMVRH